ncbi:hypothetical genomic island protein [Bartonella henselae str. Houston-1]|uniref:Hypothetical genomic island protein n=1 Tax=Bartonella henselae (strain ATCC 49882 / DSM 28221 / CCUG 30454 / Houston 1) TaxID=283166 RepID=A0A0G2Q8K7_BARHE|nr:hypothetical protein BhenCHDE101_04425 [Bartonella henselae]CAF27576.1 hypothetical protein BH07760 [Bartonella henselae str. Houston-1]CAF27705.1 hypothetical genomic island protein [Bartonella henselae str. Houston-1]
MLCAIYYQAGGEDKDVESDLSYLAHTACCLLFLIECEAKKIGCDDCPQNNEWRFKLNELE